MTSRDLTVVLLVVLGAVVLLPVLGMSLWGFGMMGPGHMAGRGMMGGWYGGGVGWFGVLALLLLVAGVVLIVRGLAGRPAPDEEPLEILKRRLARGEITPQQFDELKKALHG